MTAAPTGRRRAKDSDAAAPSERSLGVRLARVHLRGGLLAMARAELEALVADGGLDTPALADLAEVRWRSGDLTGAAAAAAAHLDEGGKEPIAMVVAAEALAARGRTAEARAQVKRLLTAIGGAPADVTLDGLFAGQPRATLWPDARSGAVIEMDDDAEDPAGVPVKGASATTAPDGIPASAGSPGIVRPSARDEVAVVEAAIDAGRVRDVAVRLAIMLREEGARAPLVLSLADRALKLAATPPVVAGLHLVAGDAFRSMGREVEAAAAYERAREALGGAASSEGDR